MNRKQLLILIVAGVILGAAGWIVANRQSASWSGSDGVLGRKLLPDFPLNDVAQLTIKQADAELNLVRDDDIWRVRERGNYPANFSQIGEFLRKMWEIKTVQRVEAGPSQFGRLELLEPGKGAGSGTLVEFKDNSGKPLAALIAGKKDMRESGDSSPFGGGGFASGRFVTVVGKPEEVWLLGDALNDAEPKPENWLNKDFFRVEKLRSISVRPAGEEKAGWTLERETEGGNWELADKQEGEELDGTKLFSYNSLLSSPTFTDIVPPGAPDNETAMAEPVAATLKTFDHFVYTLQIGEKNDADQYPLKVAVAADLPAQRNAPEGESEEDKERLDQEFQEQQKALGEKLKKEKAFEQWTYLVSSWSLDSLLKERSELLKQETAATEEPPRPSFPPFPSLPADEAPEADLDLLPGVLPSDLIPSTEPPPALPPLPSEPPTPENIDPEP